MKHCFFALLILSSSFVYAADPSIKGVIGTPVGAQVSIAKGPSGELTYVVMGMDGKATQVTLSFFEDGLKKAIETAHKIVCEMNVLPQSVTVSSVVVSVTYDTKQFCQKKADK